MNPITRRQALAGATTTALLTATESFAMTQPDLIIVNAKVTTLDRTNPVAEAVAIRDGKFLNVGSEQAVRAAARADATVIDARGRRLVPGLIDSHIHVIRGGLNYNMELRWDGVSSLADAMAMLRRQVANTPAPQWVRVVGGFTEHQFAEKRLPTLDEINAALELKNHYKNICQALAGPKMQALADVPPPVRTGKNDSPFTIFRYTLTRFDRSMLERLRKLFVEKHPDFRDFGDSASYASAEDNYKRALLIRAEEMMEEHRSSDDAVLGAALLDLASGKAGLESNLLDWRVARMVADIRASDPGVMEESAGKLARAPDAIAAVTECAERIWPHLCEKWTTSRPLAESRTIPTMIRALVDPRAMLGIRSGPAANAARMLMGSPAFGAQPLGAAELAAVLDLAAADYRG